MIGMEKLVGQASLPHLNGVDAPLVLEVDVTLAQRLDELGAFVLKFNLVSQVHVLFVVRALLVRLLGIADVEVLRVHAAGLQLVDDALLAPLRQDDPLRRHYEMVLRRSELRAGVVCLERAVEVEVTGR